MVEKRHSPLDFDLSGADLRYLSRAKLEGFVLGPEQRGWSAGAGFSGIGNFNGGQTAKKLGLRDLLEKAADLLLEQGRLTYEFPANDGDYVLMRFIAKAGTMWPSFGHSAEFERVCWWIGANAHFRILCYGDRHHILQDDRYPPPDGVKATWWPSRADAYLHLLHRVSGVLDCDYQPWSDADGEDRSLLISDFYAHMFCDSIYRAPYLAGRGVYEALVRVDHVFSVPQELPLVCGSPLWVSKVNSAVPGTYRVPDLKSKAWDLLGTWDGTWSDLRWEDRRDPRLRYGVDPEPPLPNPTGIARPEVADIQTLSIREPPDSPELEPPRAAWVRVLNRLRGK